MSKIDLSLGPFFDVMGNKDRRHIMCILHASEYLIHDTDPSEDESEHGCLKTARIAEIMGKKKEALSHHLEILADGGLVEPISRIEGKAKPVLLWKVTDKWQEYTKNQKMDVDIREFLKANYKDIYIGP